MPNKGHNHGENSILPRASTTITGVNEITKAMMRIVIAMTMKTVIIAAVIPPHDMLWAFCWLTMLATSHLSW